KWGPCCILPAMSSADSTGRAGQRIGRFELLEELGHGGFGVAFRARDTELGRDVAIKIMRRPAGEAGHGGSNLRQEAEAAARLQHPNMVTLHDFGSWDGAPYLVLELLAGETLAARLRRGALEPRRAVTILIDVARALVHAHRAGVIHRDIKPSNVFLCRDG